MDFNTIFHSLFHIIALIKNEITTLIYNYKIILKQLVIMDLAKMEVYK